MAAAVLLPQSTSLGFAQFAEDPDGVGVDDAADWPRRLAGVLAGRFLDDALDPGTAFGLIGGERFGVGEVA
ncbi:hypothetical protein [Nonomuraea sp. NPDC049158]|uniref:hypothetical protein n=1 Tax=Nonomuraea sp. NPDC049158 TaxID=3155649 RepID=UPI0033D31333